MTYKVAVHEGKVVYTSPLVVEFCCKCGIPFGMAQDYVDQRREDQATFWCPNGHGQSYTTSEVTRLKRELAAANGNATYYRERSESLERRATALRGVATRLRNRAKAGLCPYCDQPFDYLAKHIADIHPNEDPEKHEGDET